MREESGNKTIPLENLISRRKNKADTLRGKGINPYPHRFVPTHRIMDIAANPEEGTSATVSGRLMSIRGMGKASFANIKDAGGKIQIYLKEDDVGAKEYEIFSLLDVGDFIGVSGEIFHTKTNELTIHVRSFAVLAKSLRPLPEKWHGLKDIELRYRQRYVDLIVNEKVRDVFLRRANILGRVRKFLDERGFVEVETPMMQSIAGGARANPFVTHHETLGMDLFLRIAPELHLKRLIVGGMEKVYELNRNFRNEGISSWHNPEFTMLEVYNAYTDYADMMELCESLIVSVAKECSGGAELKYKDKTINLTPPWQRISLYGILKEKTGRDFSKIRTGAELLKTAAELEVKCEKETPAYKVFDRIFETFVQPSLVQPAFIKDYPAAFSPLAKTKDDDSDIAERFELFIDGQEIANAYSELNDPLEQKRKMEEQIKNEGLSREGAVLDEDYIRALEYGMPPCSGLGIGIDRLVMLLTDSASIRDVILFPQMRKEGQV